MLHRCIRISQLAVNSRICYTNNLQLALQRVIDTPVRSRSTLVGHDGYDTTTPQKATVLERSAVPWHRIISASDAVAEKHVTDGLQVYEDFISEEEERSLVNEVEPYLRRLKYESAHWDDVSVFNIIYWLRYT